MRKYQFSSWTLAKDFYRFMPLTQPDLRRKYRSGLTLVELIVTFSILLILSTIALPLAQIKIQREKERNLRSALAEIRNAIDRYKDMADAGRLGQIDPDTFGYPPNLEVLVDGVTMQIGAGSNPFSNSTNQRRGEFGNNRTSDIRGNPLSSMGPPGLRSQSGGDSRSQRNQPSGHPDPIRRTHGNGNDTDKQKIRFLRKIPSDPITGHIDWGIRAVEDDPRGFNWSGKNVFDIYSKSMDAALDGTRYSEW